jgi:hypothetical protein
MSALLTFSALEGDGIYAVHDRLSGLHTIGKVSKVYRGRSAFIWCALPVSEKFDGTPRKGFSTRREAAYALARYVDTKNREWIA